MSKPRIVRWGIGGEWWCFCDATKVVGFGDTPMVASIDYLDELRWNIAHVTMKQPSLLQKIKDKLGL